MFTQSKFANFNQYEQDNLLQKDKLIDFLFMGDSITEFWQDINPDYFKRNNFINRGISGQTTAQMLLRFQQDVIQLKPQNVVILAGINDIAENTGPISNELILSNIKSMVQLAQYNQMRVLLCSILPANKFSWKTNIKPAIRIIELNKLLRHYAEEQNLEYVDYHSEMKNDNDGLDLIYSEDGVHPTEKGYTLMEQVFGPFLH